MSNDVARKYGTTNPVLIAARVLHDPYDEFAWVQGWRFAICEALLHDWGYLTPGFRTVRSRPEDTMEYGEIRTLYVIEDDNGLESIDPMYWHVEDELKYALRILDRYREWLRIAGRDY
ncbi:hypothetical protein [Streptomyces althioticus]|uniref:hypothetical protein n=1 Tax=Streptomyces althioticus TaxID=83380 RepID=UPI00340F45A8